jgi:hypothetical protein
VHHAQYGLIAAAEQVEFFMENGYVVIQQAFTREQAAEFTKEMWMRLGIDPHDKSTWTQERIHMPVTKRVRVSEFAPKVWHTYCRSISYVRED